MSKLAGNRSSDIDSMHDRATVRGVKSGKRNKKRRPSGSSIVPRGPALSRLTKIFGAAAGVAALTYGVLWCHHYAMTAPDFAVQTIEVSGTHRATQEAIVRLSGIERGENIFGLDTAEIAKTVSAHPWVARAKITRRYPRTVQIEVTEHEPAVIVALGHLYYANRDGEIVKRYTPGEHEELPVVTGLSRTEIETDDGAAKARLRSAIKFMTELQAFLGKAAPKIAELHLDPALGLSFVSSQDEAIVLVGAPPWKPRIERFLEVRAALEQRGVRASQIMLGGERRPDRAVARLSARAEASPSSGTPPKACNSGHGEQRCAARNDAVEQGKATLVSLE